MKFLSVRYARIGLGVALLLWGLVTWNPWFLLGIIPLLVGVLDMCPICMFTKNCKVKKD